jgi:hypothetical protein
MKTKTLLLTALMFAFLLIYSSGIKGQTAKSNPEQVKNGTVYIQHPAIETTKKFWSAFEKYHTL